MRANWKAKLMTAALGAAVFSTAAVPAFSQIGFGVTIGRTPPPLRYERRPPAPGPDFVWVDGFWRWDEGRYVWVPGRWDRPPFAGAYWSHPHYDHYADGWHYHEGHWDHEDHGDHHDRDDHDRH